MHTTCAKTIFQNEQLEPVGTIIFGNTHLPPKTLLSDLDVNLPLPSNESQYLDLGKSKHRQGGPIHPGYPTGFKGNVEGHPHPLHLRGDAGKLLVQPLKKNIKSAWNMSFFPGGILVHPTLLRLRILKLKTSCQKLQPRVKKNH